MTESTPENRKLSRNPEEDKSDRFIPTAEQGERRGIYQERSRELRKQGVTKLQKVQTSHYAHMAH